MRSYDPAELTHLQARAGVRPRLLFWVVAKNRETGLPEPTGFWTGDDDETFTIGGEERAYFGAGGMLGMDDLTAEVGVQVRMMSVWLATAAPEVVAAVRGFDVRLAPVEIHRVLTDPLSHRPIAAPHRIWRGWIDGAPLTTPAVGGAAGEGGRVTVTVASDAQSLTRTLTGKYSDAAMRRRGGDDRMFRYADVSGSVPVWWGEKKHGPSRPFGSIITDFLGGGGGG